MPHASSKKHGPSDQLIARRQRGITRPAVGLESEFTIIVDNQPAKPEAVFGSPTAFVRQPMMHRTGRSYHLPTGGAVYFDTGVIEVATPMIELESGCAARAGRSLWESIKFLRQELDAWQEKSGHEIRLEGFSAHYNVSFELPEAERGENRTDQKLAVLLTNILPVPVMLLGANKESTGIGVRPRRNRIEVTADFTPDAPLLLATATLIVAIVREVMTWPSYELDQLKKHDLPVLRYFVPVPHSSRQGWVARFSCFANNPFQADPDEEMWELCDGRVLSLRQFGREVAAKFQTSIRRYADPLSRALINAVMRGRTRSLLELPQRPECYHDVGRACGWDDLYTEQTLSRSVYERVLLGAVARSPVTLGGQRYHPVGMRGWSHVVIERDSDHLRREVTLDQLAEQLQQRA